jgi:hypothetical protein
MKELNLDPKKMAEIFEKLLEEGFELPMYWVAVSANGSIAGARYETSDGEHLNFVPLVDHSPSGIFQVPVNMMFTDTKGRAARVLFEGPGKVQYFN